MGQPVVHFEVVGKDGEKLHRYYSELFGWEIDANNEYHYGMVTREGNLGRDGVGVETETSLSAEAYAPFPKWQPGRPPGLDLP